jgi:hypothetical protein
MYKKENSTQELWDHLKKELEDSIDENGVRPIIRQSDSPTVRQILYFFES